MVIGIIIDNIQNIAFQEKQPVGPSLLHSFTSVRARLRANCVTRVRRTMQVVRGHVRL